MNTVYGLERLISNCSLTDDADTFSMYEVDTTSVTPKALSGDQTLVKVEKKTENQNAYDDKRQSCLYNMKCFSKEEQHNDLLQNQKEPIERLILKVKDPLDEQLYNQSEELNKTIIIGQDNIYDGQCFLLTDVNIGNLDEVLQKHSIEKFPKTEGKVSLMVSNGKKIKRIVTLKKDLQNFGTKDLTEFRKRIQNLQQEFNRLCLLVSDLLKILQPKVNPKLLEAKVNQESI